MQKEKVYINLLPYASNIEEESQAMLNIIKTNLGLSVVMREIRPGCDVWVRRLKKYILLYGLKFSKEDHLNFIRLMYELILIPHVEPYLFREFIHLFITLLKKDELISPTELELPWKPLYNLCKSILFSSKISLGMYGYTLLLQKEFVILIEIARIYFPTSATKEMLDEWKPKLCPFDSNTISDTIQQMSYFLPVVCSSGCRGNWYHLWLDDVMEFWKLCNNNFGWENYLMNLIAVLAANNIGCINWESHLPLMFSRFLKCLELPVSYTKPQVSDFRRYNVSAIALWIVSVLGGGSFAQNHLSELMRELESYFHSSNSGRWSKLLGKLLEELSMCFINRINYERYAKLTWRKSVPSTKMLTEDDITQFVMSLKIVTMHAMFSANKSSVKITMQNLAMLRPHLIVPDVIETFYFHMEEILKPHHFRATLQCLTAVLRPMLEKSCGYKEGPTFVVPLLMAVVPGIDPNDVEKSIDTFNFISTMVSLVPIVDCSQASEFYNDLTKEEEATCLATSSFVDFISQFLDNCFTFITSSSLELIHLEQENYEKSRQESLILCVLWSTCSAVFQQTSMEIFQAGLDKLYRFVAENVLETKVAGPLIASICQSFAQANADETLKKFVPFLCNNILTLMNDSILQEETLTIELLYYLQLISEMVQCPGNSVLPHISLLRKVLDKSLQLKCREGFTMALRLMQGLLDSLLSTVPLEYRSVSYSLDEPLKHHLPVRDWGNPGDLNDLKLKFFVPGEKEINCAKSITVKYLPLQIDKIKKAVESDNLLTDDKLEVSLEIIKVLLESRSLFNTWIGSPIHLVDSFLRDDFYYSDVQQRQLVNNEKYIAISDAGTRNTLVQLLEKLQSKLVLCKEKNTKSLSIIIKIWNLIFSDKFNNILYAAHWLVYQSLKRYSGYLLVGNKKHMRSLLISRVLLQHEFMLSRHIPPFTSIHKQIMLNLLQLCASQYTDIRNEARLSLSDALMKFPYSHTILTSEISEYLKRDAILEHYVFEGVTRVILEPKYYPIVVRHDWMVLHLVWPTLIKSNPEKPSIINLLTAVAAIVDRQLGTITINLELSEHCVDYGMKICKTASHVVFKEQVDQGRQLLASKTQHNLERYSSILHVLMKLVEEKSLHYKFHCMTLIFLTALVHPDVPYPPDLVRCFLNYLINDSIELRKIAIEVVTKVLKQQKRYCPKIKIDPYSLTGGVQRPNKVFPGDRPDNQWIMYKEITLPQNAESWNKMYFTHREYHGYYCWPSQLTLYVLPDQQPFLTVMCLSSLKEEENEVYVFFSNSKNLDKLIYFLSLEEKKGEDCFDEGRYLMFKGLFRNGGYPFLKMFIPHLDSLVCSPQESSQRCAAEIIAGSIRGAKHWPHDMLTDMWNSFAPMIRNILLHMTEETIADWKKCFSVASTNRDPRWNHWLYNVLLNYPVQSNVFLETGRLSCIGTCLYDHLWTMSEVLRVWLESLKLSISHQFENTRQKVGEALSCIFEADLMFPGGNPPTSPHISDFVTYALPFLSLLYNVDSEDKDEEKVQEKTLNASERKVDESEKNTSRKVSAINTLKTICVWISTTVTRSVFGISSHFYEIVPLICLMENYEPDSELKILCNNVLRKMSQALHGCDLIPSVLSAMKKTSDSASWKAHIVCLKFLQVFVFYNMPVILRSSEWPGEITNIVLKLLEDNSLEVREKSANVLCDLVHTGFIKEETQLLIYFKERIGTRDGGKKCVFVNHASLNLHHAAILGLCAFINAYPYTVPDFVPDLFSILQNHFSDSHPIPQSIRKTLSDFQRTHQDNWAQSRLKFSEEQLSILEDITVPATYYA